MRSFRSLMAGLLVLLASLTAVAQTTSNSEAAAASPTDQRAGWIFGARLGMMLSSDITIKRDSWDDQTTIESGFSGGAMLELPTDRGIAAALSIDFHKVDPEYVTESKTMIEFGLQLKRSMRDQQSKFMARPFVGVGLGMLPELSFLEPSTFLILKGGLELDFFGGPTGPGGMLEFGVLGSPYGQTEDYTLTAAPRPFVRVGIVIR